MPTNHQNDRVPVIDISAFTSGVGADRLEVVRAVSRACGDTGFFIVTGHDVPRPLVARMAGVARTFFDLPASVKRQTKEHGEQMGGLTYFGFGAEGLGATSGEPAPVDLKESIDFGRRFRGDVWPEEPAELESVCQAYEEALDGLATRLRHILMAALGLPEEFLEDRFRDHLSSVRILNYPDRQQPPRPGQLRAGAHTDYGALTILHTEDSPGGLQLQTRDGAWIDVVAVPDSFVVNIGDAMMRWTNDRWASTKHRVINPPADATDSTRRQSVAYFCNPDADAIIECLPGFADAARPARYEPITYRAYAEERYQQAHGEKRALGI